MDELTVCSLFTYQCIYLTKLCDYTSCQVFICSDRGHDLLAVRTTSKEPEQSFLAGYQLEEFPSFS